MRSRRRDGNEADQALTRAGAVGAVVGLVPYLGALWDWGLHPLRQMSVTGTNTNFYDLQARALFHGRLDVPPGSLGIEAFVVDGRHYMYFGPFPRGDRLETLVSWQERVSALTGHPLREHVHDVDDLPPSGTTDDYYVVGDCQALYVATGERAGAWVPVQTRPVQFRVVVGDAGLRPGSARLMWFPGFTLRRLNLQANLDGQVRLTLVGAPPDSAGRWLDIVPGDVITVSVTSDTARNRYAASATVERGGALEAGVAEPVRR